MKYIRILLVLCLLLVGCQSKEKPEDDPKVAEKKENRVSFVAVGDNLMHQRLLDEAKT